MWLISSAEMHFTEILALAGRKRFPASLALVAKNNKIHQRGSLWRRLSQYRHLRPDFSKPQARSSECKLTMKSGKWSDSRGLKNLLPDTIVVRAQ